MRVWTVQPWCVWLYLKKHGTYFAKENLSQSIYPKEYEKDEDFEKAFHWINKQLIKRIGERPNPNATPIWCWYTQEKHEMPKDIYYPNQVCLELEIPEDQILLSDFDLWHIVLGQTYFSETVDSYDEEVAKVDQLPEDERAKAYSKSWEKIFNVKRDGKWIQGCIWQLNYDQVVKVCHRRKNHRPKIFIPKAKTF